MAEEELEELRAIKKLLALQLLIQGVQAGAVAKLLGMDKATFSRMVPARSLLKGKIVK